MKLKALLAFMALSLISCSDDDGGNPHETEKMLKKITSLNYMDEGVVMKHEKFYSDNRPTTYMVYDEDGQPFVEHHYAYNENDLLAETKIFDLSMGNDEPFRTEVYTYDNLDRISNLSVMGDFEAYQMNYTYNNDNTITCLQTDLNSDYEMIYVNHLDNENRVYKQTVNNEVWQEVIFDGNNIVSWSRHGWELNTTQISYYTEQEVKGPFLNSFRSQFGNQPNTVMLGGYNSYVMGVDKYIAATTGAEITEWIYEFDAQGYPVKATCYSDGSLQPDWVYEIEYEQED